MGLLDFLSTPSGMGLLSAAAGAMAGARKGRPWNTAGIGLTTGLGGYALANDQIRKSKDDEFANQYKSMQMQKIQDEIARSKAEREWRAGLPGKMDAAQTKVTPYEADNPFGEDLGQLANVQQGDQQALQQYLMHPDSPYADKLIEQQLPKAPKWTIAERYNERTGMPEKVLMDENNPSDIRPFGGAQADTIVMDNLGGHGVYRGSHSAEPQSVVARTITPDSLMSAQTARRGQDIGNANAAASRAVTLRGQDMTNSQGKAPAGYRYTASGNLEAIPGGPADIKAGELGDKRAKQISMQLGQADAVLNTVKEAKGLVGYSTAGVGGLAAGMPMTRARDLAAKLTTIKANLGFDRLQQMRDSSPTGGALGQVAVQELVALQATIANLDQQQSPGELKKSLNKIETHYNNWKKTVEKAKTSSTGGAEDPLGIR